MTAASPRERAAVLRSLRAKTAPLLGIGHIRVGRDREVRALERDLDRVVDGGSTARFVIGEPGSGTTFFLNLVRGLALDRRMVVLRADLTADRSPLATTEGARSLYTELTRSAATPARQDGGALAAVVERFASTAVTVARERGRDPERVIRERAARLEELPGGGGFAEAVAAYWRGHHTGDGLLAVDALRWLRGECPPARARAALGLRATLDDVPLTDRVKLLARFTTMAGYRGLLVCLDELDTLAAAPDRAAEHEGVRRIVEDSLGGGSPHLAHLFAGTPSALTDPRYGLHTCEALRTALPAAGDDLFGPVVRLRALEGEEFTRLLVAVRDVHAGGGRGALPDEALREFARHCADQLGADCAGRSRAVLRAFLDLLSAAEDEPGDWAPLVRAVRLDAEQPAPRAVA
ncbi:DUF2791 family P-loop domain-containing protein [Actinosynnema pretiosum subsp. pretiosum]|uniref:DUF2791 family P-loop domain-containing protein n=1 Tax=Actinosynnema pretiosum subsp. pretiosum TaxID=103721 RepID=A0AA45L9J5_9PSEU|nr:DUF2791 family P-loop domain-containing protein [Actinosynnema pretiosum subsp. pretiosum]